jgi:hypothetical protein
VVAADIVAAPDEPLEPETDAQPQPRGPQPNSGIVAEPTIPITPAAELRRDTDGPDRPADDGSDADADG